MVEIKYENTWLILEPCAGLWFFLIMALDVGKGWHSGLWNSPPECLFPHKGRTLKILGEEHTASALALSWNFKES